MHQSPLLEFDDRTAKHVVALLPNCGLFPDVYPQTIFHNTPLRNEYSATGALEHN